MTVRPGIAGVVMTIVLAACGSRGPEPPAPDRALIPETVELADHWDFALCQDVRFTLRSGATVVVMRSGIRSEGCPEIAPTPQLFGTASGAMSGAESGEAWTSDTAPLIFVGSDGDRPWFGSATRDDSCWRVWFVEREGAFLETASMHLATGPVLPLADGFRFDDSPEDLYPLRAGDSICLDAEGRVLSILVLPMN